MIAPVALALHLAAVGSMPSLELTVWPQGQRVWQGVPLYAGASVSVKDPQRELACPEIRVDWGDGSLSSAQTMAYGCDPYSMDAPRAYLFVPRMHAYRGPGRFVVVGCVVGVRGEGAYPGLDTKSFRSEI